jgi:hypothetical protein
MKILIGTPTKSGDMTHQYVASLVGSLPLLQREGFSVFYYPIAGQLVEHARNVIAARALTMGVDKVIFLDDDVSWKPQDLVTLANFPHHLIGGTYRKKDISQEKYAVAFPETARDDTYGAIEATYIPCGFMKIERVVLEQMRDRLEPYPHPSVLNTEDENNMHPFFKVLTHGEEGHSPGESEDMYFCVEWRRLGGTAWVYPNFSLNHVCEVSLESNFPQYLESITISTEQDSKRQGGEQNT